MLLINICICFWMMMMSVMTLSMMTLKMIFSPLYAALPALHATQEPAGICNFADYDDDGDDGAYGYSDSHEKQHLLCP